MYCRKKVIKLLVLLFAAFFPARAQDLLSSGPNHGFNLSASLALGTHFQRLGINFHFYYLSGHFQANTELRAYYNFKNLGPKRRYPELVFSQGFLFAGGDTSAFFNPFIGPVSNQTAYRNAVAYAYHLYFNRIRTTQQTGMVSFLYEGFSLILENDILARPTLDRFRSGAFLLQYQHGDIFQAALNCSIWTGQFGRKQEIFLIRDFYNNCYMDTIGGRYTQYSHGLLSLQMKYHLGYSQNIQLSAGIDAEQVRNSIQNKLIHNLQWPATKTRNCHLPMLDTEGKLFLYREGQKVRAAKPYLNLFTNASVFY